MTEEFCPCCPNRCAKESLKCGRGRAYFGGNSDGSPEKSRGAHGHGGGFANEEEVVTLLRRCGHLLHHGGGLNTDALDADEKARLTALLKKCLGE